MGYMDTIKSITASSAKMFYTMDNAVVVSVTLKSIDSNNDVTLSQGQTLGMITTDKKYNKYDNSASDGREVAVGFLLYDTVVPKNGIAEGLMVVAGVLKKGSLTDYDSNAATDLKAREIVLDSNTTVVVF